MYIFIKMFAIMIIFIIIMKIWMTFLPLGILFENLGHLEFCDLKISVKKFKHWVKVLSSVNWAVFCKNAHKTFTKITKMFVSYFLKTKINFSESFRKNWKLKFSWKPSFHHLWLWGYFITDIHSKLGSCAQSWGRFFERQIRRQWEEVAISFGTDS